MPCCAVFGCHSHNRMRGSSEIKYYSFPKNPDLALKWMNFCGRENINLKYAVICSKHFDSKYLLTSLKYRLLNEPQPRQFRNLQKDAVPTLYAPSKKSDAASADNSELERKLIQEEMHIDESLEQVEAEISETDSEFEEEVSSMKTKDLLKELKKLKRQMFSMEKEIKQLKSTNDKLIRDESAATSKLSNIHQSLIIHFTQGQIKRMLNPDHSYACWDTEDIAAANELKDVSLDAYKYLRERGFPLPALSTLKRLETEDSKRVNEDETEITSSDELSFT